MGQARRKQMHTGEPLKIATGILMFLHVFDDALCLFGTLWRVADCISSVADTLQQSRTRMGIR